MKTFLPMSALAAVLIGCATLAQAQQAAKLSRIGFLSAASNAAGMATRLDAFRLGLQALGYVEGRNIVIEYRWAAGKAERLRELAAELERMKVDVIVTAGPAATHGAKQGTTITPIVMAFDSDPVGSGFVASLARPGGNITGLSVLAPEISGKQLDVLKQIVPKLSRVVVLGDSKEPANARSLQETERAAAILGLEIRYLDIRTFKDLEDVFQVARRERADALLVLVVELSERSASMGRPARVQLAALAAKNRLPAMYPWPEFVDAGGLITYSVGLEDLYRRAASYVDKILKGAKAGDLPVELPYKFDLVINLKAAKQIGLTIPVGVLTRADRVVE
jgi:putative tryptophan/tyrosine transport system substrate-binding protein